MEKPVEGDGFSDDDAIKTRVENLIKWNPDPDGAKLRLQE